MCNDRKTIITMILLSGFALICGCAYLSVSDPPTPDPGYYECRRVPEGRVTIDGFADESVWRRAPVMKGFRTAGADPQPAAAATAVRMLWDDQRLYLFFECESPNFSVYGTQRNDEIWHGEAAETFLAPEGPDRPYYEINVNPDGVVFDSRIYDWRYEVLVQHHERWAGDYEAGLELAVRRRENDAGEVIGWDLELAIPFADLGVPDGPEPGDTWLFNVCRAAPLPGDGRIEFSAWHPTMADFHRPHRFATLKFSR